MKEGTPSSSPAGSPARSASAPIDDGGRLGATRSPGATSSALASAPTEAGRTERSESWSRPSGKVVRFFLRGGSGSLGGVADEAPAGPAAAVKGPGREAGASGRGDFLLVRSMGADALSGSPGNRGVGAWGLVRGRGRGGESDGDGDSPPASIELGGVSRGPIFFLLVSGMVVKIGVFVDGGFRVRRKRSWP